MSYRLLQLPPLSTQGTRMRISIRGPWSGSLGDTHEMQWLRSWLVYDSGLDGHGYQDRVRWGVLLGLGLALGLSASFWTAVGLLVAHGWK